MAYEHPAFPNPAPGEAEDAQLDEDVDEWLIAMSLQEFHEQANSLLQQCSEHMRFPGTFGPLQVAPIPGEGRCFYNAVMHQCGQAFNR